MKQKDSDENDTGYWAHFFVLAAKLQNLELESERFLLQGDPIAYAETIYTGKSVPYVFACYAGEPALVDRIRAAIQAEMVRISSERGSKFFAIDRDPRN